MYKSILKSGITYVNESDKVMIDTNALIAKKLEALSATCKRSQTVAENDGFIEGLGEDLDAERVAALLEDGDTAESSDKNGSAIIKAQPVYDGPSPEELVAQAQAEIEQMRQSAAAEIGAARAAAVRDGHKEGYDNGYAEGMMKIQAKQAELDSQAAELKRSYESRMKELEPMFIEKLTGIYEHIFNVSLANDSKMIMYLVENTLRRIDGCRDFMVHVSKEDYPLASMQKKQLTACVSMANASLEIIEDQTLSKNECMIETEGGIFDCSLGTQLEELTKQLKLLSYTEVSE